MIIKHLKKLMKSDSTDSSQAICSVCQAIRGLCRYDLNRQRFAEIGACETIVELLKYARNGFNVDIIISCCEAMRNLCFGSMVNKLTLVNAGVCICKYSNIFIHLFIGICLCSYAYVFNYTYVYAYIYI